MFKVNHYFDETKNCQKEFKTLKDAIFYCNEFLGEKFQIVKIQKGKIVDIYNVYLGGCLFLTACSCSTGRFYNYFK